MPNYVTAARNKSILDQSAISSYRAEGIYRGGGVPEWFGHGARWTASKPLQVFQESKQSFYYMYKSLLSAVQYSKCSSLISSCLSSVSYIVPIQAPLYRLGGSLSHYNNRQYMAMSSRVQTRERKTTFIRSCSQINLLFNVKTNTNTQSCTTQLEAQSQRQKCLTNIWRINCSYLISCLFN